jgi:hypothetical protein
MSARSTASTFLVVKREAAGPLPSKLTASAVTQLYQLA